MREKVSIRDKSISVFLDELSRDVPTLPGGGSAAAVMAALAAGLEKFVLSVTAKKVNRIKNEHERLILRLEHIRNRCEDLMDLDMELYMKVIEALKIPVTDTESREKKEREIQRAFMEALNVPEQLMKYSFEILGFVNDTLKEGCYRPVLADAAASGEIAYSSFWAALWIARANLKEISDESFVRERMEKYKLMAVKLEKIHKNVRKTLEMKTGE